MTPWRSIAPEPVWKAWMTAFGIRVRRTRELLGLSQERLAKEVGTTQGTISRFEVGRSLHIPFLGILRIHLVLARELRRLDQTQLSEDARRLLAYVELLQPSNGGTPPALAETELAVLGFTDGPEFERLVQLYRALPEGRRGPFVDVVTVVATVLHD